jgi:hypothetical protein
MHPAHCRDHRQRRREDRESAIRKVSSLVRDGAGEGTHRGSKPTPKYAADSKSTLLHDTVKNTSKTQVVAGLKKSNPDTADNEEIQDMQHQSMIEIREFIN